MSTKNADLTGLLDCGGRKDVGKTGVCMLGPHENIVVVAQWGKRIYVSLWRRSHSGKSDGGQAGQGKQAEVDGRAIQPPFTFNERTTLAS